MKKLFNSSSLLVGLILVLIGVLGNRKSISGSTEKAMRSALASPIANVLFKDNYAEQWRREASAKAYRYPYVAEQVVDPAMP